MTRQDFSHTLGRWETILTICAMCIAAASWYVTTNATDTARTLIKEVGYTRGEGNLLEHRVTVLEEIAKDNAKTLDEIRDLQERILITISE